MGYKNLAQIPARRNRPVSSNVRPHMEQVKHDYFLEQFKLLDIEAIAELQSRRENLADEAIAALDEVIIERGFSFAELSTSLNTARATNLQYKEGPTGIGGWLTLLIAGLMILGPLMGLGRLSSDIISVEKQYPGIESVANWNAYKYAVWITFATISAISFWGGLGLERRRVPSAVSNAKVVLWIIGPVASCVMGLLLPFLAFGKMQIDEELVSGVIVSAFIAGMWTIYLTKSTRVKNTYFPSSKSTNEA